MKKVFVSIHAIIDTNNDAPVFEPSVISNLYKLKRRDFDIILVIDDALLNRPVVQYAINILNGEFLFNILNAAESIDSKDDYLIENIVAGRHRPSILLEERALERADKAWIILQIQITKSPPD
jgi:hypothetical protein